MRSATAIIIGAGHSGLAMSWHLASPFDRPRGPRARRGGQLMADGAVGLASPPDAELAKPPAGLRLCRRRSGRLHDACRRSSHFLQRYAELSRAPVMTGYARHAGAARWTRATSCRHSQGAWRCRTAGDSERGVQSCLGPVAQRAACPPRWPVSRRMQYRQSRPRCRMAACMIVGASASGVQLAR